MESSGKRSLTQSLRRRFASTGDCDAESAAHFIRGDVGHFLPDEGCRQCWAGERQRLLEWASINNKLEPPQVLNPLEAPTRGTEQLVYPSPSGDRLHKYFYVDVRLQESRRMEQGMFGWIYQAEIRTRPASPAEAMARIAWFNRLYPEAKIEIEGVDPNGRIHTSQPFVDGRLPVSFNDLVGAMKNDGWEPYLVEPTDASTSTFYLPEVNAYLTNVH